MNTADPSPGPDQLQVDRRGQVDRIHLHYDGQSQIEVRGRGDNGTGDPVAHGVRGIAGSADRDTLKPSDSWVDVRSGFLNDPEGVLQVVLNETRWAQGETWRYERYVPEQRLGAIMRRDDQPLAVRQTELHLRSAYAAPLLGVAAILYRNGQDFQGLHADRSMRWLDQTLIAILVLGERRPFRLRPRRPLSKAQVEQLERSGEAAAEDVELMPGHGDLIVLGGRCQRDWMHGVPACDVSRERISLTWRWTSKTGRPDTGAAYGEGVHYSDAKSRPFRRTRPI